MVRYGYLSICEELRYVEIAMCTEPTTVRWFIDEITKAYPSADVRVKKCRRGHPYSARVYKIQERDLSVISAWLIRELCHAGWEPYDSGSGPYSRFRKTLE